MSTHLHPWKKIVSQLGSSRRVWIHAASVGETKSVALLARRLADLHKCSIVVTNRSRRALEWPIPQVDDLCVRTVAPNELNIHRFLGLVEPSLLILVESELWPRMIMATRNRDIPIALVNARVSQQTARNWQSCSLTAWVFERMINSFQLVHAQSAVELERLHSLGLDRNCRSLIGNLKLQTVLTSHRAPCPSKLDQLLRTIPPGWVAVSLHPGEEEILLEAHSRLVSETQRVSSLILLPRHPLQGDLIEQVKPHVYRVHAKNVVPHLCEWSASAAGLGLVFVGASLPTSVVKGGHNLLEPLVYGGNLALHGPCINNCDWLLPHIDEDCHALVKDTESIFQHLVKASCMSGPQRAELNQQRNQSVLGMLRRHKHADDQLVEELGSMLSW